MKQTFEKTLVVAISSRALFDMSRSHEVFENEGIDAYCKYQIKHEAEELEPGIAFPMVQKFLALNRTVDKNAPHVEIVLVSRNSADTGLRIFNSIQHYKLHITRAAFTGGSTAYPYAEAFGADLFLSADPSDVGKALDAGHAAATVLPSRVGPSDSGQLRIAFDGDAVIFSDEAERIFQEKGLRGFTENEKRAANNPLPGGPFRKFLSALHQIQRNYNYDESPIRTALITTRAAPCHERVIRTLRAWEVRVDESYFLGGMDKAEFLKTFGADIFFDDQFDNCESASKYVPTGHVPSGVTNRQTILPITGPADRSGQ